MQEKYWQFADRWANKASTGNELNAGYVYIGASVVYHTNGGFFSAATPNLNTW